MFESIQKIDTGPHFRMFTVHVLAVVRKLVLWISRRILLTLWIVIEFFLVHKIAAADDSFIEVKHISIAIFVTQNSRHQHEIIGSPCIIDLINWNWNWNCLVWRLTIQLKPCLYSNKYVISSLLSKNHRTMQHCTPIKWFAFKCDAPQWSAMHTELNRKPIELDATVELWLIPFNGQFSNQSIEALSDAFALILLSLRVLLKVVLKSIPHKLKLIDFEWVRFFQAISRKLHSYEWI